MVIIIYISGKRVSINFEKFLKDGDMRAEVYCEEW